MRRFAVECRLAADRAALIIAALFLLASGVALERRELAAIEAGRLLGANASLPTRFLGRFNHRALLPPAALSVAAVGQADVQPFASHVSLFAVKHALLDKHQIEDPLALLAGRFDLAFVMVWLLPLVILALTYDLVSSEKEVGTLALALAQSGSLHRLLRSKLAARALLLALLVSVPLLALLFFAPPMRVALWAATVVAYALFWVALAVAVNLLGRSSAANATMLTGAWLLLLVVVPAGLSVHVSRRHPLPSRLDALAKIRSVNLATAESGEKLLNQFLQEHPDLAAGAPGSGQYYAIRQSQERNILPLVTALEEQLGRQQAAVARYSVLSPAIIADELLLDIAGTGRHRFETYRSQLRTFLDRWRTHFLVRAFRGGLVTSGELDTMPSFAFAEEPRATIRHRAVRGIVLLLMPTVFLASFGVWRLRTFRGV